MLLSLLIISNILLIILLSKHRKSKKSNFVSSKTTEISNISSEPITEKVETISDNKSAYKSLIPEFVPSDNTDKEFLIVGVDIPDDFTYFTPINKKKNAYVKIITECGTERYDYIISQDKQYITLMKNEKIKLINCKFDPEVKQ